jgi:hypothetical protein
MSHYFQQHTTPLNRTPIAKPGALPVNTYLAVTGEFDHISPLSSATGKPDERHVFAWINVTTGTYVGKYEAAIDVHSNRADSSETDPEEVKYHLAEESVTVGDWPPVGVNTKAALSFTGLGLKESDFTLVEQDELHHLVQEYASNCDRISVFGLSYTNGTGLHDVHLNDGQNKDGAVAFYYDSVNGGPLVRWLFLKFQTPVLA